MRYVSVPNKILVVEGNETLAVYDGRALTFLREVDKAVFKNVRGFFLRYVDPRVRVRRDR